MLVLAAATASAGGETPECLPRATAARLAGRIAPPSAAPPALPGAASYPLFAWPLERALGNGVVLVNYADGDTTPAVGDYECGPQAYDGHRGTDLTLHDFRAMDRGVRVVAAAPGTVAYTEFTRFDRNTAPPWPDDGNYVIVDHGDGTFTWYLHLRRSSITVEPGESVARGQMLGLTGSSGYSTAPHLHFEAGEYVGGWWTHRDPWNGACQPLPSLWQAQAPYVGDDPLSIVNMGVFTEAAGGGNIFYVPYALFTEGLSLPAVLGEHEPYLAVWFQFQGQAGDSYRIELRRPDGTLFGGYDYTLTQHANFDWTYWIWYWDGNVGPADYGSWTAKVLIGGTTARQVPFQVGAATDFAPRFFPVSGRSFRIDGTAQRDTLRVSPLGGPVTYSLLGAPGFVTLESDSIVRIGPASDQPTRSLYFGAVATDAFARADTMRYHVVDPSKPPEGGTGIDDAGGTPAAPGVFLASWPDPARAPVVVRYAVAEPGRVRLRVYDLAGRLVRTLVDGAREPAAAGHLAAWDGRDAAGRRVPAGVYFYRLETARGSLARKLALLE